MGRPDGEDDFADLLQSLRVRSGRSYEDLARSTFTSRSTLHRYCTGAGLPVDDEVVTRLGAACGADPDELSELTRRWKAAVAERDRGPARPAVAVSAAPDTAAPTDSRSADPGPADPGPPSRELPAAVTPDRSPRRARLGAAGLALLVVAGAGGLLLRGGGEQAPSPAGGDDVCTTRADVSRADGPSGVFDASWDSEQVCPNRANAPVFLTPMAREDYVAAQAGTLYSTESWFVCWTAGRMHAGGNRIWYYTQGDVSHPDHRDRHAWGFVPARYLDTVVDPDPGTPQCPPMPAGSGS